MTYIVAFFALGTGAMISMICGFGLGVIAMMCLPHVMSSTMASSATVSMVCIFQSAVVAWTYRSKIQWKDIVYPLIPYLVISAICIYYGKLAPNSALQLALGVFLIALSIYFIFISKKVSLKHDMKNGLIAGALGGIMSSLFGVGGPPASLYYSSAYDDKEVYLATIQTYFLVTNIYSTTVRMINGVVTKEVLLAVVAGVFGMLAGTYIGKKIFDRIDANTMRKATYVLMAVSGVILVVNAL